MSLLQINQMDEDEFGVLRGSFTIRKRALVEPFGDDEIMVWSCFSAHRKSEHVVREITNIERYPHENHQLRVVLRVMRLADLLVFHHKFHTHSLRPINKQPLQSLLRSYDK